MAADPIEQFKIEKLVDFGTVNLPVFGKSDLAFTNSHLAMTIAFVMVVGFLTPGHIQDAGRAWALADCRRNPVWHDR